MASSDFGGKGLGMRNDSARSPPAGGASPQSSSASRAAPCTMRVKQGGFEAEGPPNHVTAVTIVNRVIWAVVTMAAGGGVGAAIHWLW
jgi:hypothetical protein